MKIRLGLVGARDAIRFITEVVQENEQNFEYLSIPYTNLRRDIEGMINLVKSNIQIVDAFVFSGLIPYNIALNRLDIPKPCFYIPHNAACIYKTLWQMREEGVPLDKISFDMISKKDIHEALHEVGLKNTAIYNREYEEDKEIDPQELANWHSELWRSGKINAAISCLYSTHQILTKNGVPAYRVLYPKSVIRQTLEEVIYEMTNKRLKTTQIAVTLINIDDFSSTIKRYNSEYEIQKIKLKLLSILLDFAQTIQGSLFSFGGDEYIIFTTRGAIVSGTVDYTSTPFMEQVWEELSITISCGIGFGKTVYGSEMNARVGLSHAKNAGGNCVFIADEDGSVTGPVGKSSMLHYSLSNNGDILKIANEIGLSATYISKLKSIREQIGEEKIHAKKLAPYLYVTERSARRILSILAEKGYAEEIGEETSGKKGRPRKVYFINL